MQSAPSAAPAASCLPSLTFANRLVSRLPPPERQRLVAGCDTVGLLRGAVLCTAQKPLVHVYFPLIGSISVMARASVNEVMETRRIGNEGVLGATLALDSALAPQLGRVQSAGLALRIASARLHSVLGESPVLHSVLRRYLFVILMQATRTACCARFHTTGSRLARALLVAHDHAQVARFRLTHETLAEMLGVQRGAVTLAAGVLQKSGAISYMRGNITVLDRQALEAKSCVCYGLDRADYSHQFGDLS